MIRLQGNEVIYNNSENLGLIQDVKFVGEGISITLTNGEVMFIPEEDSTQGEREVFSAYHEFYKDTGGIKPVPIVIPVAPMPTEMEVLQEKVVMQDLVMTELMENILPSIFGRLP